MKFQITFLFFVSSFFGMTQNWQTIPMSVFESTPFVQWNKGNISPFSFPRQHFQINPYDQSIWGMSDERVFQLKMDGNFNMWDGTNCFFATPLQKYNHIGFTPQKVFLLSYSTGIYTYNGTNWSQFSSLDKCMNIDDSSDTLFITRLNENFLKVSDVGTTIGNLSFLRRIVSRDSFTVGSDGLNSGDLLKIDNGIQTVYTIGTSPFYLDYKNYDFKFTKNGDTLFTSGDLGFSIAVNGVFIDTLTKNNTINMPDLPIIEFEFDSNNNIWAVFATASISPQPLKIGFLDRSTNTWSMIFDQFNSPLLFPKVTLELDSNDNLWVANEFNLHVLKMNATPQWLGEIELSQENNGFMIYPNPSENEFFIESNFDWEEISILDASGRALKTFKHGSEIHHSLEKGTYLVVVQDKKGNQLTRKLIVN